MDVALSFDDDYIIEEEEEEFFYDYEEEILEVEEGVSIKESNLDQAKNFLLGLYDGDPSQLRKSQFMGLPDFGMPPAVAASAFTKEEIVETPLAEEKKAEEPAVQVSESDDELDSKEREPEVKEEPEPAIKEETKEKSSSSSKRGSSDKSKAKKVKSKAAKEDDGDDSGRAGKRKSSSKKNKKRSGSVGALKRSGRRTMEKKTGSTRSLGDIEKTIAAANERSSDKKKPPKEVSNVDVSVSSHMTMDATLDDNSNRSSRTSKAAKRGRRPKKEEDTKEEKKKEDKKKEDKKKEKKEKESKKSKRKGSRSKSPMKLVEEASAAKRKSKKSSKKEKPEEKPEAPTIDSDADETSPKVSSRKSSAKKKKKKTKSQKVESSDSDDLGSIDEDVEDRPKKDEVESREPVEPKKKKKKDKEGSSRSSRTATTRTESPEIESLEVSKPPKSASAAMRTSKAVAMRTSVLDTMFSPEAVKQNFSLDDAGLDAIPMVPSILEEDSEEEDDEFGDPDLMLSPIPQKEDAGSVVSDLESPYLSMPTQKKVEDKFSPPQSPGILPTSELNSQVLKSGKKNRRRMIRESMMMSTTGGGAGMESLIGGIPELQNSERS